MMTQEEAIEEFMPRIESRGAVYEKFTQVDARRAVPGEVIVTHTSDGKETENTAKDGDFVIRNHTGAREEYLIPQSKFDTRYERLGAASEPGWDLCKAKGRCQAIVYKGPDTQFIAAWGEPMRLRDGDLICTPLPQKGEVYRIAAKEFDETYQPVWDERVAFPNYDRRP